MRMHYQQQQGVILIVSLMLLLILTFIAVSTLQTSSLEERIAGDFKDEAVSLQAADSIEREAEDYLDSLSNTADFNNSNGLYSVGNAPNPFTAATWGSSNSRGATQTLPGTNNTRYFIELIGDFNSGAASMNVYNYGQNPNAGAVTVFRVVSRATDTAGTAESIVETYYGRRF